MTPAPSPLGPGADGGGEVHGAVGVRGLPGVRPDVALALGHGLEVLEAHVLQRRARDEVRQERHVLRQRHLPGRGVRRSGGEQPHRTKRPTLPCSYLRVCTDTPHVKYLSHPLPDPRSLPALSEVTRVVAFKTLNKILTRERERTRTRRRSAADEKTRARARGESEGRERGARASI